MKSTQSDRGLQFDGIGEGPAKGSTKYKHNQWSGHSNDGRLVNYPGQKRVGNDGACHPVKTPSSSVTKDAYRRAPDTAGAQSNTKQVRNPGGTRTWEPSKTQNYKGNPDQIRIGQSGGTSYGATSRGSRPVAPGSTGGINYGPKSQY